jgi:ferredoxin/flavodoxin
MKNRRTFLKMSSMALCSTMLPSCASVTVKADQKVKLSTTDPKSAVVCWYSQTGNTARTGRLIAETLKNKGLNVLQGDYRDLDQSQIPDYDIIIMGSPIFYYDVPENFKTWLREMPEIKDKPSVAYVTFGGTGGNQHNTACTLLNLLVEKGGVPIGFDMFGSMSSFAITWSYGNEDRVLAYKHMPDHTSYDAMRAFAGDVLDRIHNGQIVEFNKGMDFREWIKTSPSIWLTQLFISQHTINESSCIECGTCIEKCPVGAIDLEGKKVNGDRCIACLGCINNCPAQAVEMVFMGKDVYGLKEFVKRNNIDIPQPRELNGAS